MKFFDTKLETIALFSLMSGSLIAGCIKYCTTDYTQYHNQKTEENTEFKNPR